MARILKARRSTADNDDRADVVIDRQPVDDEFTHSDHSADAAAPERTPLGRLFVEAGLLTQNQVDDALQEGSLTGERLGEIAVRRKLVTEDDVARLLAHQWGLDYVERSSIWFDPAALARLSREDAQELEALPTRVQDGRVVVAVAEPTEQRLAALREVIGDETVMVVVPKSALEAGLRSDLLASRASHAPAGEYEEERSPPELEAVPDVEPLDEAEQAAPEDEPEPELESEPEPEPEPAPKKEPKKEPPPVAALPVRPRRQPVVADDGEGEADAVLALANEARAVAERLAAQAVAVRAQVHQQNELLAQTEVYESRIGELEQELEAQRLRVSRVRDQLAALLDALGD